MAHEFLRNDVLMTLPHRAEIFGPQQRAADVVVLSVNHSTKALDAPFQG
jgi:hypothetical protein